MPALRTRDIQSRPLEVTTDAPHPPTFAIISPTPRAFTFPITHNLTDSPYSSPSNSPFEPELNSLPLRCTTPPNFIRTLSTPDSSLISASPPPLTHKRRKSSCSSDFERRPKRGDEDYIKRPENAFILFRRKCCEDRQMAQDEAAAADGPTKKQRQADLSKTISQQWRSLSTEERQYWEQLAKEKKKEHEQMYPNYVYRPQRSRDKDGRSKSKKPKGHRGEFEHGTDSESVSFVLPMMPRHHGRSASAPTPPLPYQSIQMPNVYQMTPSCPTSPSLLPMISRRSSHPGHADDALSNFDFLPSENFMPPSFGQAGQFEASLQSSEFLRNMFDMSGQPAIEQRNDMTPLQGLPMSQDPSILLPAHQIISPSSSIGSGSSGPSSPRTGPFTPTSSMLCHSFSQLNPSVDSSLQDHSNGCLPEPQSQAELEMQMQLQQDLEFSSYSWENNSMAPWQTGAEVLYGDDFDLNSIPPIELGLSKFNDEMGMAEPAPLHLSDYQEYGQHLEGGRFPDHAQNLDGLLGFEEMMAGHNF